MNSGRPLPTVEEGLIDLLRQQLIDGTLRPGERLQYRDLAEHFGVSVTPVRVALRELSSEGLVDIRPHAGAWVSSLSVGEVEEIFATRIGVEGWLARQGAPLLTRAASDELDARVRQLLTAAEGGDRDAYILASRDLRVICYTPANRPRLLERFRALFRLTSRYHCMTLADDRRLSQSCAYMERFYEACRAGDGIRAEYAIRDALSSSLFHLVEIMSQSHVAESNGEAVE